MSYLLDSAIQAQDSRATRKPPSMTVVVCIESGILEPLTLRMVDSLRRFGGRFANLEVVAVTPRLTPPLARETHRRMAELGIKHLRVFPNNPYGWHHYMNKAEAIVAVEERVTTEAIAWVDSDILFVREPNSLELSPSVDFLASAPDAGVIGSRGGTDPNDPFWGRSAALIGKVADDLPWLQTGDGHRIRFYWNAGLYVYRRSTRFGREFLADFKTFLDRHVARTHSQVHFMDQVVLGLTVLRLGLAWQALQDSSNFPVCSYLPGNYDGAKIMDVSVLHFHDSMEPQLWSKLMNTLVPGHPQIREWLEPQGPVALPSSIPWSLAREVLRMVRGARRRLYYARSGFTKAWSMSR
ncbi:glycosyltransferase family 2 protein [Bradyrhizobium hipponense]|uniref:Glycosyltransferase family 2 protein n=1 Tax=Bradyrhizobium hipponense TaxID=2605638 RepID=A0A5S4YAU7_9BRAD|nr:glycosyltransferase family 2 protein [Bradyrhizobium hipponense]TYO61102.1 glycosyltransferase family 2 protein [Bradyrhizobium hipponense]